MRNSLIVFVLISGAILLFSDAEGQRRQQKPPEKTRLLFLVDASGSMLDPWGGGNQTKLSVARRILNRIVDSLRQNNRIELGLRLYGHKAPPGVVNCKDTDLEVPFRANNHQEIINRINAIKPKGVTPIAYALEQSANDFPSAPGYRNMVILITDGIESCGGDPCAVSRALQKRGVFLQPYIIGIGMRAERSLECAGKFLNADTPGRFYDLLNEAIERSFAKTTVSVLLQGQHQRPEPNINVTFLNNLTGIPAYEFVNYIDRNNKPDSVEVDPLVEYDLVVNTLPPIRKDKVAIKLGGHTNVTIPVLQGNLIVRQEAQTDRSLQLIVREKGKPQTLHVQMLNQQVRYLAGDYEVEALTMPRRVYPVKITPDKTFSLTIPAPGIVNINTIGTGYGSLYEVNADGTQTWVTDLDDKPPVFTLSLLPGTYKVVFRVKNSPGSKYTAHKTFTIRGSRSHQVNVFDL